MARNTGDVRVYLCKPRAMREPSHGAEADSVRKTKMEMSNHVVLVRGV